MTTFWIVALTQDSCVRMSFARLSDISRASKSLRPCSTSSTLRTHPAVTAGSMPAECECAPAGARVSTSASNREDGSR